MMLACFGMCLWKLCKQNPLHAARDDAVYNVLSDLSLPISPVSQHLDLLLFCVAAFTTFLFVLLLINNVC